MENAVYVSRSRDPYANLAAEERLCRTCGGVTLFLWQNRDTVVIGRNQSALRECDLDALQRDGVKLARRTTGGGAVFHDDGNLCFSVIFPSKQLDKTVGYRIVRKAVEALGISTDVSGRNDITLSDGRKFSGNAFRLSEGIMLHHGTLLINSALDRMGAYLRPTAEKLQAHGVESVRARVANLSELRPVSVEDAKAALEGSFHDLYGECGIRQAPEDAETMAIRRSFSSDEWLYEKEPDAAITLERRFPWGALTLVMSAHRGIVESARAFTDGMDPFLSARLERCLTGCPMKPGALSAAVQLSDLPEREEIAAWLRDRAF